MAEDEEKKDDSRYKPEGFTEDFPVDMGESSMQVASIIDLGREAYKNESFDSAIKYFNRALDMDPTNKEAKFLKRKTMATLSRLLEGKSKVEDDEDVEKELVKAISRDVKVSAQETVGVDDKVTTKPSVQTRPGPSIRERPRMYKPPKADFRKKSTRAYSIPDTDRKFTNNAKHVAYRSGDSFLERKEARILVGILILFLIGVLLVSVYFGWIPI